MTFRLATIAALLPCLLAAPLAQAAEQVGQVSSAKASVFSSGDAGRKELQSGSPVFFMDRLSTNGTGLGEFVFSDGTKLALGPSASLVVDRFVAKKDTAFQRFGVNATKGTFRWISGKSASSAYQIRTPTGTMGIRGTAFDVTSRGGRTYVVLLNGEARFCAGAVCRLLNRTGDYISTDGSSISPKMKVTAAFRNRRQVAGIFPFLANPRMLSAKFRVPGSYLFFDESFGGREMPGKPGGSAAPGGPGGGPPSGGGGEDGNTCGGNCGNGQGGGSNNGTGNEGSGKGPN